MAYNVPTVTTSDISFGPGVVYIDTYASINAGGGGGGTGADPTTQVGAITEDGVTFEFERESKMISQGNPKVPILYFDQANGAKISFTGIEWNMTRLSYMLGTGTVDTSSAPTQDFQWGGDPLPTEFAIYIKHYSAMLAAQGGSYSGKEYISIRAWKCCPQENISIQLGQDEHQFSGNFSVLRADTDWAGNSLANTAELIKVSFASAS